MTFRDRVLTVVRQIPAGQVMTYGEVAAAAGQANAARAVGAIMRANRKSFVTHPHDHNAVPCLRVVCHHASLGGFNAGVGWKRHLLRNEGWQITGNRLEHS